jgi:hypothetical protein
MSAVSEWRQASVEVKMHILDDVAGGIFKKIMKTALKERALLWECIVETKHFINECALKVVFLFLFNLVIII